MQSFARRILTELWDKLRQWHEKLCKKYSDAIRQLKIGKKRVEENLRAAEEKLRFIEKKKANAQSSLASLLKPYGAANLDPYGDLPKRDELVVKIYALVAALEERTFDICNSTCVVYARTTINYTHKERQRDTETQRHTHIHMNIYPHIYIYTYPYIYIYVCISTDISLPFASGFKCPIFTALSTRSPWFLPSSSMRCSG